MRGTRINLSIATCELAKFEREADFAVWRVRKKQFQSESAHRDA